VLGEKLGKYLVDSTAKPKNLALKWLWDKAKYEWQS